MKFKRILHNLLFPCLWVRLILLPVAVLLLTGAFTCFGDGAILSYIAYTLSAYTLVIWCISLFRPLRRIRGKLDQNKYAKQWLEDVHLRVSVTLFGSLLWNACYAVFQLCLGVYHASFWYYATAVYYLLLALMRFFLFRHTRQYQSRENMEYELVRYRTCGWVFLVMNVALGFMILFMVQQSAPARHHPITAIAMATYTFIAFTTAIVSLVRYRKYSSPVYAAAKAIGLAAACVSMLTLESTMLTTFDEGKSDGFRQLMMRSSGAAVSVFIVAMSVYMIVRATRQLKRCRTSGG